MNIYFSAAIFQEKMYGENYKRIVKILEELGHKVIHEHITTSRTNDIAFFQEEDDLKRRNHYKQVVKWITSADLIVCELSFPSTLNVGHEVTLALDKNKPVIGLFSEGKESAFFRGLQSEKFIYEEYNLETLRSILANAIQYAQDQSDTRFNFFISPMHVTYLEEVSKERRIPKSVYLRQLIEEDKMNNPEYSAA